MEQPNLHNSKRHSHLFIWRLFKENIEFYLTKEVKTPPPRIYIMGIHGSGVNTQLKNLNEAFHLPIF